MLEDILAEVEKIKNKTIIVEGKNDKVALEKLGCKNVITLEKKALFEVVEGVKGKEVLILTDFDKKGQKLYDTLYNDFQQRGVRVNSKLRALLAHKKIVSIEDLSSILDK